MKKLLYKEFHLSMHTSAYVFLLLSVMMLIPSYPYYVAFIYVCLSVFFTFLQGRENKDIFFTATLPVARRDIVKARCTSLWLMQLAQVLMAVPFAILGVAINPNGHNAAGIEANAAFFGLVLIMFAVFDILYFPSFYKTGYNAGKSLLLPGAVITVYIVAAEISVHAIPVIQTTLDTFDPAYLPVRLGVLAAGIAAFAGVLPLMVAISAKRFEKVEL